MFLRFHPNVRLDVLIKKKCSIIPNFDMYEDCDGEFKRKSDFNVHITMNINHWVIPNYRLFL